MVLSGWNILCALLQDIIEGDDLNAPTPYEKQRKLIEDMNILSNPELLREEGFPLLVAESITEPSQQGQYIFSLSELEIGKEYLTKGNTHIRRESQKEVKLGEIYRSFQKNGNGIVTIHISQNSKADQENTRCRLSGVLIIEIMKIAIEDFTESPMRRGIFLCEYSEGNLHNGRNIKNLEELSIGITYISTDCSIKLTRTSNELFSFIFAGYNCNKKKIIPDDIPEEEPLPTYFLNRPDLDVKTNIKKRACDDDNELAELDEMVQKLDIHQPALPLPIPPPPPPPPPMIKQKSSNTPSRKKMRPLRWSTIPRNQLQATIWGNQSSPNALKSPISIKERDIERLFSISPVNSPVKKIGKGNIVKRRTVLPLKRANNISIVLSRLPPVDEIKQVILLESTKQLTVDQLSSLASILPLTEEEIKSVKSANVQITDMTNAERFVFNLSSVSRLREKVLCLQFMNQFTEYYDTLMPEIQTITLACTEAKSSNGLKQILKLILEVGSILNRDTYLSGHGFRLQSLKNVCETKGKCEKVTLAHYIAQLVSEHEPQLLTFEETEMPHCEKATKISMDAIIIESKEITKQMEIITAELTALRMDKENQREVNENFTLALEEFYKQAKEKVRDMQAKIVEMQQLYNEVGTYYGEDPSEISNSSEFFATIHQFAYHLKHTQADNHVTKIIRRIVDTPSPQNSVGDVSQTE